MNLPWTLPLFYTDFFNTPEWIELKDEIISLSESLSSYARYLNQKASMKQE